MKRNNKAFTIVELVIVITVIAILAAVLIPTFSNLIEKANVSNDTVLVKNLNTALVVEEVEGGANKTMHEALEDALKQGFSVEKLTPRSTGDILWDQKSNRFALVKDNKFIIDDEQIKSDIATEKHNFWKIVKTKSELDSEKAKGYSFYLSEGFDSKVVDALQAGIDTGNNEVESVKISSTANELIVRTNSKSAVVEINAENATVYQYGEAKEVKVTAVAEHSLHLFANVLGNVTLEKGRLVVEETANVSAQIIIDAKGAAKLVANKEVNVLVKNATAENTVNIEANVKISVDNRASAGVTFPTENVEQVKILNDESVKKVNIDGFEGEMNALVINGGYKLTGNLETQSLIYVEENTTATLDLNGMTINSNFNGYSIINYGKLIIIDSIGNGCVYNSSKIKGNNGNGVILNYAEIIINSGTFGDSDNIKDNVNVTTYGAAVRNEANGTCTINGGYFTCLDNYGKWDNNETAYSYAIRNYGEMTINYAEVYGAMNGGIAADAGNVTINNINVNIIGSTSFAALATSAGKGTFIVNGGKFIKTGNANPILNSFNGMPSWDVTDTLEASGYVINGGYFKHGDNELDLSTK